MADHNLFKEVYQLGSDATGTPHITDWKKFYTQVLVPTYHHDISLIDKIAPFVVPAPLDAGQIGEVYTEDDVEEPIVDFEIKHHDTSFEGAAQPVYKPIIQESILLTDLEAATPFAGRSRLPKWVSKATKKIKNKAEKMFFQGSSKHNIVGAIGGDTTDLGNPTGVWDVDTGSNGILNNFQADIKKVVDHFSNNNLDDRLIKIVLSKEAYNLAKGTYSVHSPEKNNIDFALAQLPPGSWIDRTNNIQATAPEGGEADNTMVAFCSLLGNKDSNSDEGGYSVFRSGINQKTHKVDVDKHRYWIGERFSVKFVDDAYVCWMDAIDCVT